MQNDNTSSGQTVMDYELRKWLSSGSNEARDVIIEADLPPRRIKLQKKLGGDTLIKSINSPSFKDRNYLLNELNFRISQIVGNKKTRILQAAGAIVVHATAKEINTITNQLKVKAIRTNRRFYK